MLFNYAYLLFRSAPSRRINHRNSCYLNTGPTNIAIRACKLTIQPGRPQTSRKLPSAKSLTTTSAPYRYASVSSSVDTERRSVQRGGVLYKTKPSN